MSSYMCSPETAAQEFETSRQLYHRLTGREITTRWARCAHALNAGASALRRLKNPSGTATAERSICLLTFKRRQTPEKALAMSGGRRFQSKEAAKPLNFLIDNGLTDSDELTERAAQIGEKFDVSSLHIKQLVARMAEVAQLMLRIHKTVYNTLVDSKALCASRRFFTHELIQRDISDEVIADFKVKLAPALQQFNFFHVDDLYQFV